MAPYGICHPGVEDPSEINFCGELNFSGSLCYHAVCVIPHFFPLILRRPVWSDTLLKAKINFVISCRLTIQLCWKLSGISLTPGRWIAKDSSCKFLWKPPKHSESIKNKSKSRIYVTAFIWESRVHEINQYALYCIQNNHQVHLFSPLSSQPLERRMMHGTKPKTAVFLLSFFTLTLVARSLATAPYLICHSLKLDRFGYNRYCYDTSSKDIRLTVTEQPIIMCLSIPRLIFFHISTNWWA